MTSPSQVRTPLNRLSDSGALRGNGRKVSEDSIKTPAYAGGFGAGRVMLVETRSFEKGDTIHSDLTYALRAPNGQRIPISPKDLHDWIEDHYKWGLNKRRNRTMYAREAVRGMWEGSEINGIPLKCGAWTLLQSDEDYAGFPQMHTLPLSKLVFDNTEGRLTAHYLEKKNTPNVRLSPNKTHAEGLSINLHWKENKNA